MAERTGCGIAIPLGLIDHSTTQCGLGFGKPWLNPPQVALCPACYKLALIAKLKAF